MFNTRHQFSLCSGITLQFIGHNIDGWHLLAFYTKFLRTAWLHYYLSFSVPEYLSHSRPDRQIAKNNAGHHLFLQILHLRTTYHQVVHCSSKSDYNIVTKL
jgi:hypothetical protein